MNPDLKSKLFSSVILSTKPNPLAYKRRRWLAISPGGILSIGLAVAALIGLGMLLIAKVKYLF